LVVPTPQPAATECHSGSKGLIAFSRLGH